MIRDKYRKQRVKEREKDDKRYVKKIESKGERKR